MKTYKGIFVIVIVAMITSPFALPSVTAQRKSPEFTISDSSGKTTQLSSFKGKVVVGGAYIPQGQLQPSGNLIDPEQIKGEGRILVGIESKEDLSKYLIVPGSTAQVAVYTHHMHHLAILRKVLLRMKSWTNFIFGDGH